MSIDSIANRARHNYCDTKLKTQKTGPHFHAQWRARSLTIADGDARGWEMPGHLVARVGKSSFSKWDCRGRRDGHGESYRTPSGTPGGVVHGPTDACTDGPDGLVGARAREIPGLGKGLNEGGIRVKSVRPRAFGVWETEP